MLRKKLRKIIKMVVLGVMFSISLFTGLCGTNVSANDKTTQNKTVILDAGHGGRDSGAIGIDGVTKEKDLNLSLTKEIKKELESRGINVLLTREDDSYPTLNDRIRYANSHKESDAYLSIHHNSHTDSRAKGSLITYDYYNSKGEKIARNTSSKLAEGNNTVDRGAVKSNFYTRKIEQPAVIVEVGFMSNKEELQKCKDNQKEIAKKLADGVQELYDKGVLK